MATILGCYDHRLYTPDEKRRPSILTNLTLYLKNCNQYSSLDYYHIWQPVRKIYYFWTTMYSIEEWSYNIYYRLQGQLEYQDRQLLKHGVSNKKPALKKICSFFDTALNFIEISIQVIFCMLLQMVPKSLLYYPNVGKSFKFYVFEKWFFVFLAF